MPDRAQDTEAIRAALLDSSNALVPNTLTERQFEAVGALGRLVARLEAAERDIAGYRRALVAHHDIATISEEVLREYDYRACPVCARAALAAAAPGETTRGGLIHTPTKRVMGVDAPDFGDPIGGAAPGETEQTPVSEPLMRFLRRLVPSPRCAECGRFWFTVGGREFCGLVHLFEGGE